MLRIAQRRWLTIVVFFLLALIAAGTITYLMTPQYESKSQVYISTQSQEDAVNYNVIAIQRTQSYAQLADSRDMMQRVIAQMKLDMTPNQLADKVSSSVVELTTIVELTVKDEDPAVAQEICKAVAAELTAFLPEVETLSGAKSPIKATIVSPASYNGSQVSPKPVLNMIIGAVLGLVIGAAMALIRDRALSKGDVLEVARVAGIQAAKRTGELIPLCHPIGLDAVAISLAPVDDRTLRIEATVSVHGRTGVEMEALTAVAVAALTVYDMCKSADRSMQIGEIALDSKSGGRSGDYRRAPADP